MTAPADDSAVPGRPALGDDRFLTLKTITAFDAVRLRVPAIWGSAYDEKAGMWCCCLEGIDDEPAEDDCGTLWIDGRTIELLCLAGRAWSGLQKIAEETLYERRLKPGFQDGSGRVDRTPDGVMLRYAYREDSKGKSLISERWHLYVPVGRDCHVVHYSLILTAQTAGLAPWRALVATMDREIRAAVLNLPGMDRRR